MLLTDWHASFGSIPQSAGGASKSPLNSPNPPFSKLTQLCAVQKHPFAKSWTQVSKVLWAEHSAKTPVKVLFPGTVLNL